MPYALLVGVRRFGVMGYGTRIKVMCKGGSAETAAIGFLKNPYKKTRTGQ
jgi:hypothetical protein